MPKAIKPPPVLLVQVEVKNYRNCRKTRFRPNQSLSALVGVNGSGKTTILNAISLLKKAFSYERSFARRKIDKDSKKASLEAVFGRGAKSIRYKAKLSLATNERNADEITFLEEWWNFDDVIGGEKLGFIPLPTNFFAQRNSSRNYIYWSRHGRDQLVHFSDKARSGLKHRAFRNLDLYPELLGTSERVMRLIVEVGMEICDLVGHIKYYSAAQFTNPLTAPSSFELDEDRALPRFGTSTPHVNFLYDLYRASKQDDASYKQFINIISGRVLGLLKKISFKQYQFPTTQYEVRTGGKLLRKRSNREIIIPFFSVGDLQLSPNQLSEGTFKTIALVFYLVTDHSRILLIEEPEVCVHHGLLRSIVELMRAFSKEKQIIFSTHSDIVLDYVSSEDVFLTEYRHADGIKTFSLTSFLDSKGRAALKSYLANTGPLGEFIRHGGIARAE